MPSTIGTSPQRISISACDKHKARAIFRALRSVDGSICSASVGKCPHRRKLSCKSASVHQPVSSACAFRLFMCCNPHPVLFCRTLSGAGFCFSTPPWSAASGSSCRPASTSIRCEVTGSRLSRASYVVQHRAMVLQVRSGAACRTCPAAFRGWFRVRFRRRENIPRSLRGSSRLAAHIQC